MLHLFIDIKLKFTKLETEAVQPTENVDVAVADAVSALGLPYSRLRYQVALRP